MSQNWTALLSLIVVLHITPKRYKWRYSHAKAPPPILERRNEESPKLFIRYLKENWNIICNFNQFENQFLNNIELLSWNQRFYILSLFFFTNFNHYWIKYIWVVLQTTLIILFLFKFYIHTNNETLVKITNYQNHKLSKLQINEIANHTAHNDHHLKYFHRFYTNYHILYHHLLFIFITFYYVNVHLLLLFWYYMVSTNLAASYFICIWSDWQLQKSIPVLF